MGLRACCSLSRLLDSSSAWLLDLCAMTILNPVLLVNPFIPRNHGTCGAS
jgi:hypothetical protein